MAYGDPQQPQIPEKTGEKEDEYYYPNDMWNKTPTGDASAQVREALFGCKLPTESDFEDWFPALAVAIDLVARIPGFDTAIYSELNRDMEDLVDRSNSQGRRKIISSKMKKFVFKLRSLVPKGDIPIAGVTGVTAMITTNQNIKQDVRMPQQQPPSSIFSGLLGGKK